MRFKLILDSKKSPPRIDSFISFLSIRYYDFVKNNAFNFLFDNPKWILILVLKYWTRPDEKSCMMMNIKSKTTCLLILGLTGLAGCKDPTVEVGTLGKKLAAPVLKSSSPFDQNFNINSYVRISGTCDSRVGDISVSFKISAKSPTPGGAAVYPGAIEIASAAAWHTPPNAPNTTGTTLPTTTVINDVNCADGSFDFYLTKNDLLSIWGFDGTSSSLDVNAIYIKGSTLIGDTQTLPLIAPGPTMIAIEKQWPRGFAVSDHCQVFNVNLLDAYGKYRSSSTPVTFDISRVIDSGFPTKVLGYTSLYDCNKAVAPGVGTFTIPIGQNSFQIMLQMPTASEVPAEPAKKTLSFSVASSGLASAAADSLVIRSFSDTYHHLAAADQDVTRRILKNTCYPVTFSLRSYYPGGLFAPTSSLTIDLSIGNPNLSFYTDSASCSSATASSVSPSLIVPASTTSVTAYVKYFSNPNDITDSIKIPVTLSTRDTFNIPYYDFAPFNIDVDLIGSATVAKIDFWGPNEIPTNSCIAYKVVSKNNRSTPISTAAALSISLSSATPASLFYSDPNCATIISQSSIAAGSSEAVIYFKTTNPANTIGTMNSSSPGILGAALSFNITP